VRAYAERRGWQRGETFRNRVVIFGRGAHSLDQLLVPLNPDISDFTDMMERVVQQLAAAEGVRPSSVLQDLLSLDVDTIRFSVRSPVTDKGTLPLEQGLALLDGARRSLLAAACTVLAPESRYHRRMSRTEAENFIDACEIGQTEKGSYTVTLRAPVGLMDSPLTAPENAEIPFARKATQTLALSMTRIAQAIDEDRVDSILETEPGAVPVTANLCEALLKMQPERENSALAFSVSWAASYPAPTASGPVILRNEYFPLINVMSHRLRGEVAPQAAEFIGHVDELRGVLGDDGRRRGEVRLTVYHEDEAVKAAADLSAEQYESAARAHMTGQRVVVRGVLNRGPRLSTLNGIVSFGLLIQVQLGAGSGQ
jgi:hypothetical protein